MRRSLSAIILTIALTGSAASQDASRWQRAIDALPSPVTAERLGSLAADDPNAYVYYLQNFLGDRGLFKGAADGLLTSATIAALLSYCRERSIGSICATGPLLPEAIAAVARAIAEEPTPTLPEGWNISDNGRIGSVGLNVEVVSAGTTEATLRVTGKAVRQGYINIWLSPLQPSLPGTWVTSVSATSNQAGKNTTDLWLRTAVHDSTGYIGELFDGQRIPEGDRLQRISLSGTPKEGALELLPYVQLWVREGDEVDVTLTLADPSFERQ